MMLYARVSRGYLHVGLSLEECSVRYRADCTSNGILEIAFPPRFDGNRPLRTSAESGRRLIMGVLSFDVVKCGVENGAHSLTSRVSCRHECSSKARENC